MHDREPGREIHHEPEHMITVFVLRHGESSEDKTNPKRGLTEKGQDQVRAAVHKIIATLDPKHDAIRLYDSSTDRTNQQLWLEHDMLTEAGFAVYVAAPSHAMAGKDAPEGAGSGIAKRLSGIEGSKEAIQKLRDPAYQKSLGTDNPITAWLKEPNLPEGVSTPADKLKQFQTAADATQRIAEREREKGAEKRIVVIANSHSSGLTAYAAEKLGLTPDAIGEVENAEGFRVDFSGRPGEAQRFTAFGEKIEKIAKKE